jgi:hypothetical protein
VALRFDAGTIGKVERTPQGGLRVTARLTRVGILEYRQPDGSVRRELRPPEEVFKADSLGSLRGAPITDRHPGVVSSRNYRALARGHVGDDVRQDGDYVEATVFVQDSDLVDRVESGAYHDVSAAYHVELDPTPGTWRGKPYDVVQRDIRYNAAGLGPKGWGRAGTDVALRLDGAGDEIGPDGDGEPTSHGDDHEGPMTTKTFERIDGIEYEVGTDAHRDAVGRREKATKDAVDERSRLQARADSAEAETKELKARLATLESDLPKRAAERAKILQAAQSAGVEVRADSSDHEIRVAIVGKIRPALRLDGHDETYVRAVADIALADAETAAKEAGVKKLGAAFVPRADGGVTPTQIGERAIKARAEFLKRQADAYKGPRAAS